MSNVNEQIKKTELDIATKIHHLREKTQLELGELAKIIDIDQEALFRYESGIEPVPASILALISAAFGVEFDYFYTSQPLNNDEIVLLKQELQSVH